MVNSTWPKMDRPTSRLWSTRPAALLCIITGTNMTTKIRPPLKLSLSFQSLTSRRFKLHLHYRIMSGSPALFASNRGLRTMHAAKVRKPRFQHSPKTLMICDEPCWRLSSNYCKPWLQYECKTLSWFANLKNWCFLANVRENLRSLFDSVKAALLLDSPFIMTNRFLSQLC